MESFFMMMFYLPLVLIDASLEVQPQALSA
jgi:hypothetical protein